MVGLERILVVLGRTVSVRVFLFFFECALKEFNFVCFDASLRSKINGSSSF